MEPDKIDRKHIPVQFKVTLVGLVLFGFMALTQFYVI